MKRLMRGAVAVLVAAVMSGCASVVVESPAGDPIQLATTGKVTPNVKSFKKWYFFWGLVPVSETSTAQNIKESGFKVVRVVTKMSMDDFLMAFIGAAGIIPCSRTVEIWGE